MIIKKIAIYIVMAMLCPNFIANAQENKAVDVTLKGIQIGQKVPDIGLTGLHNYKDKDGKPATSARLSDFKGKLLIIDFWATWCSPCVAMIPKMDSLQKEFGSAIQFLPVTYQSKAEVLPFLERLSKQHPSHNSFKAQNMMVFSDKVLHSLFPHSTLPHYVWVGPEGIVKAITGYDQITSKNIADLLDQKTENMSVKMDDLPNNYDRNKPFLIDGNGGNGNNLLYHSVLTGYTPGLIGGLSIYPTQGIDSINGKRIFVRNASLTWLYSTAFGNDEYIEPTRVRLNVSNTDRFYPKDSLLLDDQESWSRKNLYCYELIVPASLGDKAYEIMRMDLNRFFRQYKAGFEKEKVKCLILTRTSDLNKFQSLGGKRELRFDATGCVMKNAEFIILFRHLKKFFQNSGLPIINETGYAGNVDLNINANMMSISAMNEELKKYDLQFIIAERDVDMLVIRDSSK